MPLRWSKTLISVYRWLRNLACEYRSHPNRVNRVGNNLWTARDPNNSEELPDHAI